MCFILPMVRSKDEDGYQRDKDSSPNLFFISHTVLSLVESQRKWKWRKAQLVSPSVLIKPATLEVRHFLNLTSRTVLLFFLVLYVIVEQSAALILWICSLLIPP